MNKYPKIAVTAENGEIMFLRKNEIVHGTSEGSYTHLVLKDNREITVAKRLKVVLDLLGDDVFVRTHHSHLINLNHVECFRKEDCAYVVLSNGDEVPVSKTKTAAFLRRFTKL